MGDFAKRSDDAFKTGIMIALEYFDTLLKNKNMTNNDRANAMFAVSLMCLKSLQNSQEEFRKLIEDYYKDRYYI